MLFRSLMRDAQLPPSVCERVPCTFEVRWGRAAEVLVDASAASSLLVLARRDPRLPFGSHLGPVVRQGLRLEHLQQHYALYGDYSGVRTARKHIVWYVKALPGGEAFRGEMNLIEDCDAQLRAVAGFFDALAGRMDRIPPASADALEVANEASADALA